MINNVRLVQDDSAVSAGIGITAASQHAHPFRIYPRSTNLVTQNWFLACNLLIQFTFDKLTLDNASIRIILHGQ